MKWTGLHHTHSLLGQKLTSSWHNVLQKSNIFLSGKSEQISLKFFFFSPVSPGLPCYVRREQRSGDKMTVRLSCWLFPFPLVNCFLFPFWLFPFPSTVFFSLVDCFLFPCWLFNIFDVTGFVLFFFVCLLSCHVLTSLLIGFLWQCLLADCWLLDDKMSDYSPFLLNG